MEIRSPLKNSVLSYSLWYPDTHSLLDIYILIFGSTNYRACSKRQTQFNFYEPRRKAKF